MSEIETEKEPCKSSPELMKTLEELYPKERVIPLSEVLQSAPSLGGKVELYRCLWGLKEKGLARLISSHSISKSPEGKVRRSYQIGPVRTNYSFVELTVFQVKEWFTTGFRSLLFQDYRKGDDRNFYVSVYQGMLEKLPVRIIHKGGEAIAYLLSLRQCEKLKLAPVESYILKDMSREEFYKLWREICDRPNSRLAKKKVIAITLKDKEETVLCFVQPTALSALPEEDLRSL